MLDRVDRAIAFAEPNGGAILDALRRVREQLDVRARDQKTSGKRTVQASPIDKRDARATTRGEQLRIIEISLKESNVGEAIATVHIYARAKKLDGPQRVKLTAAVTLLRARYDNAQTMIRLAAVEPCSELHARILNPRFDKIEEDLARVSAAWQLGHRRLTRP
jgi:hypothetical protein